MDATKQDASLAEQKAHTELMKAHAGLMKAQTRKFIAEAVQIELMNATSITAKEQK